MSQTIRRTKFRIKDVIDSNLNNQEQSAQKAIQSTYIKQNVDDFNSLKQTLEDRKLTFIKFAFQQQELIEDRNLGPVLTGLSRHQNIGSMSVSELIPKSQIHTYLLQAQQDRPKRVLKRFAHWEWDKDQGRDKNPMSYQFTQRNEAEIKSRLKKKDGEISLRKRILQKWQKHLPSLTGLNEFGKQFTMDHSSLKKPFSLSPSPKQESYRQITNWLQELEELKLDNEKVKKKLERTLQSLHRT
ncbi:unnamed protein product (macronuclear) [Paramecium tetraurelia]|uniref:Uncharacterized protein n=1 Tax=Paramecium tetraurelia TaxID=5888 RepID=A0CH12_PARTE|nr:uncharacterized protein GSPATT00007519001 [Paramecium tetraurelia]CAK70079.1 unnamed protein product [Paramecium tetraurelia]|eukprot:XP_001437476.1 hypothetical protein (macronuclear) [Paramecium tetraurelia strain d4-2]